MKEGFVRKILPIDLLTSCKELRSYDAKTAVFVQNYVNIGAIFKTL